MRVVWLVAGSLIVLLAFTDALNTLVATRRRPANRMPTMIFYRYGWRLWRSTATRMRDEVRRESWLTPFGPLSLFALLGMWITLQLIGWSMIWWSMRSQIPGIDRWVDGVYYGGIGYFTVGFGDIVPTAGLSRVLVLGQAFLGVTTTALVIGYLPTIYGAYREREVPLLSLDDLSGERITPVALVETHTPDGRLEPLADFFMQWERWTSGVLESHSSYPMLMLFRSKDPGQSWVTGLGLVLDASVLSLAVLVDPPRREAALMYRRGVYALGLLARRFRISQDATPIDRDLFRRAYDRLEARGFAVRPFEEAYDRMQRMRKPYADHLESAIVGLLAPRGFWGHQVEIPVAL